MEASPELRPFQYFHYLNVKRFKKMKILTRLDFERKGNLQLFKMIEVLRRLSKIINPDNYRDVVRWQ